MNDTTAALLRETAVRILRKYSTGGQEEAGSASRWDVAAWLEVQQAGLHLALVPEECGGVGIAPEVAVLPLRDLGFHASPLPLAESVLANRLLSCAGLAASDDPLSIAVGRAGESLPSLEREGRGWRLCGRVQRVPWARSADSVVLLAESASGVHVARVPSCRCDIRAEENLAQEERDDIAFDLALKADAVGPAPQDFGKLELRAMAASLRIQQISGALERVTKMTVDYALNRQQFGRPIAKFQAVQQNLAVLAGHAAAATAAADIAAGGLASLPRVTAIAAAKLRASEAAGAGAALAHQIHGAIGFSYEYQLNFFTRRLWSWRDEFGNEAEWGLYLGQRLGRLGADNLWGEIASI